MAPSDLILSDFKRSNSMSLRFQNLKSDKGAELSELCYYETLIGNHI